MGDAEIIKDMFDDHCKEFDIPYMPAIMPAVKKIIAFGDIHGDYKLTIEMLEMADLIKYDKKIEDYVWIGEDTYVVQVGDQIDMCRTTPGGPNLCATPGFTENDEASDTKILELFTRLDSQARKKGGAVISLLGNHELMNVMGDMRYVSYENLKQFDTKPGKKDGMNERAKQFKPGNKYAKLLGCTRYSAVIIGSNIFVHAGIIDGIVKYLENTEFNMENPKSLENINIAVRKWLLGLIDEKYVSKIISTVEPHKSIFWTRILGRIKPGVPLDSDVCRDNLKEVIEIFHVGHDKDIKMIIGHTPQSFLHSDDINSTCGKTIWRVDNGSSKAFNDFDPRYKKQKVKSLGRKTQYLKIMNDNEFYVCDRKGCKRN